MVLIDDFGYEGISLEELDKRSMEANNSSAYCFRTMTGSSTLLSSHAGFAVDINPVQNPYVRGETILPESGRAYLDRRGSTVPGLIAKDSVVYKAFKESGWKWGGDWFTLKDFQHFEKAQ